MRPPEAETKGETQRQRPRQTERRHCISVNRQRDDRGEARDRQKNDRDPTASEGAEGDIEESGQRHLRRSQGTKRQTNTKQTQGDIKETDGDTDTQSNRQTYWFVCLLAS